MHIIKLINADVDPILKETLVPNTVLEYKSGILEYEEEAVWCYLVFSSDLFCRNPFSKHLN